MANHKSLWIAPALALLLISSGTVTVGATAPKLVRAAEKASTLVRASEKSLTQERRVKVRKGEEERFAKQGKSYAKQTKTLAKQYKAAARLVAKQGGKATALLEAAAYFENKVK
jgi:hypothetical protein